MRLTLTPVEGPEIDPVTLIPGAEALAGREPDCAIFLPDSSVSRRHARLEYVRDQWMVIDLGSRNRTIVNDAALGKGDSAPLKQGDLVRVGPWVFSASLERNYDERDSAVIDNATDEVEVLSGAPHATVDQGRLLHAALEFPRRLAGATSEEDVFSVACRFVVEALGGLLRSSWIVVAPDESDERTLILGREMSRHEPQGAEDAPPTISRRMLHRAVEEHEGVAFLQRRELGARIDATVPESAVSVGACFIEHMPDGRPILLYVLGDTVFEDAQQFVASFLGLVASLVRQQTMVLRRARLSKYFSPSIIRLMMQPGGMDLVEGEPRLLEATSAFFDLRGFSLATDASAGDLAALHADLRQVLSIVTEEVFSAGGAVMDFQGDGMFAVWGAPLEQSDQSDRALRCATRIMRRLYESDLHIFDNAKQAGQALCGIGIDRGEVLAGPMGAVRQFKYGVLGPSVNTAARLESLTKPSRLNCPVILTQAVADGLGDPEIRTRPLGRIVPAGMDHVVELHELVLDRQLGGSGAGDDEISAWTEALTILQNARTLDDLQKAEHAVEALPATDPRRQWLLDRLGALRKGDALKSWDGTTRYTLK